MDLDEAWVILGCCFRAVLFFFLAVLKAILYFALAPPPRWGPGGESGLSASSGNQGVGHDSGPDLGGCTLLPCILAFRAARFIVQAKSGMGRQCDRRIVGLGPETLQPRLF
jgi:hypothetical protein